MNSEFHKIELDRIRYSIVWEDYISLYNGLNIEEDDELLIITSAGCSVLNACLKFPERIVAVDINPHQNKLLEFKLQLYKYSNYDTLATLLGLKKGTNILEAFEPVKEFFCKEEYESWKTFFSNHPEGMLSAGQLENYIHQFYKNLDGLEQEQIKDLFQCETVELQVEKFNNLKNYTSFEQKFKMHFSDTQLSKGRDPKLFKYADEDGGLAFYNRLENYVHKALLKDNFYIHFFFFGLENIKEQILPPCYRKENFHIIKNNTNLIEIRTIDLFEYIENNTDLSFNKASLSNIFEYTSTGDFEQCIATIKANTNINKLLFWNLLHEQGISKPSNNYIIKPISEKLTKEESCFYFKNVRLLKIR
jgi:S-adenosylmethionine-diacylglycerol 3-amino-3-carboxypropyl transferase